MQRAVLQLGVALSAIMVVVTSSWTAHAVADSPGRCAPTLTRKVLDRSIKLATKYLVGSQLAAGNFRYAYDWRRDKVLPGDSQVRQAGATWGLATAYRYQPTKALRAKVDKALALFTKHSRLGKAGRYIVYPKASEGSLGTVALIALAHIELLRVNPGRSGVGRVRLEKRLNELLRFIVAARVKDGRFHAYYSIGDGSFRGQPSPYFDGEALLALTLAARHLGRKDLIKVALAAAEAGYNINVTKARAAHRDSSITKGYYQWSSMAYYAIATSSWPGATRFGDRLIELAMWMIDVHKTLRRSRNTAYAYEGIVPAYALARMRSDRKSARKLGCTIDRGLRRLVSWQVGASIANAYVRGHKHPPRSIGGIQNHRRESLIRVDVVQHQLHAMLLARKHRFVR